VLPVRWPTTDPIAALPLSFHSKGWPIPSLLA
jgi:hypothetical protein